jgi:hypothetical protein
MKRETTIIFSSLALLTVLGFCLPVLASVVESPPPPPSVITRQVIQMDNGDKICLIPNPVAPYSPCPIVVDCDTEEPLNSENINRVLTATPLFSPCPECGTSDIWVGYAGVPDQACPKIVLRAADTSLGATWVVIGGRVYYK